jgi:hypothetical protein
MRLINLNPLLIILSSLVLSLYSCIHADTKAIRFDYILPMKDSLNIYLYHNTSFSHEESNSKFAIGQSECEILKDTKKTFAETSGFAQIDTVVDGKVFISTQNEIHFIYKRQDVKFEIKIHDLQDKVKPRLNYAIATSNECK